MHCYRVAGVDKVDKVAGDYALLTALDETHAGCIE